MKCYTVWQWDSAPQPERKPDYPSEYLATTTGELQADWNSSSRQLHRELCHSPLMMFNPHHHHSILAGLNQAFRTAPAHGKVI